MNRTLLYAVIGASLLQPPADPTISVNSEQACEADRKVFYAASLLSRYDGTAARNELLSRVDGLILKYREGVPICMGRLQENKAYLLVLDGRLGNANRVMTRYLESTSFESSPDSHIRSLMMKGYVLSLMGETVEGSRSYYEAAAHAYEVTADLGSRALAEAASTARILGDRMASSQYINATLRLIRDSLSTNEGLDATLGLVLTSRAILTEQTIDERSRDASTNENAQRLLEDANDALNALPREGQSIGFRAVASSLRALALAMMDQKAAARLELEAAHDLASKVGPSHPSAKYEVWMAESRVCAMAEDNRCALSAALNARQDALSRSDLEGEARAIEQLGLIAEDQEDWEKARSWYQQAVASREIYRDRLGLQDWNAAAFATLQLPYRGLVRTYLALDDAEEAFRVLDATRARYLQDLIRHHEVRRTMDESRRRIVDSLSTKLIEARVELYRGGLPSKQSELTSRVSYLQSELERQTPSIRATGDSLHLPLLQERLSTDGRTLVSYFIDDNGSTAFVVSADTLLAIPISATTQSIHEQLRHVGSLWREDEVIDPMFSLDALHDLYNDLWGPLKEEIKTDAVVIIPDAAVSTIPFSAMTSTPATSYESADYLTHTVAITYELSASLALRHGNTPKSGKLPLLMGIQDFDGSMWNTRLATLEHVVAEIRNVRRAFGGTELIDDEATETAFYAAAQTAPVIHLASHAEANLSFPLSSKIELEEDGEQDGTLYLYEILETTLQAQMVVLSGCSTGRGRMLAGEGIVGLQYGMRAAGAESTVATLWPVADQASATMMSYFYKALANGQAKDRAMQTAQQEYLATHSGIRASPFFWAAPVVSGNTVPLRTKTMNWAFMTWTLLLATIVLGIAWMTYRIRLNGLAKQPL